MLLKARPACVALDNASDLVGTDSGSGLVGDVVGSGDSVPQDQPSTTTASTSTDQHQPAPASTVTCNRFRYPESQGMTGGGIKIALITSAYL